ncbi:MAG: acylphosphatase [Sphingomonadaceae bacterium]|nr:acylphosphatase [Sphingomonadaceae bacterium]
MAVTRRLRINGRVQGVFYRGWSVKTARGLGLRGWVRNCGDGSVEMLLHGDEGQVEAMIARCREGPPAARVDRVDVTEDAEEAPAGFEERATL